MSEITLQKLSYECHKIAKEHGFYDKKYREVPEILILIISEIIEALEEYRKNGYTDDFKEEIADTFIRLFDACGYWDFDIEKYILEKMKINRLRPYKHSKRF